MNPPGAKDVGVVLGEGEGGFGILFVRADADNLFDAASVGVFEHLFRLFFFKKFTVVKVAVSVD